MKTPGFWYKQNSLSKFLAPLSVVYGNLGRRHRRQSKPQKLAVPVICIGNIVSGGSGKTPTAIALLKLLQESKIGLSPAFLTRGYRGKVEGPEKVDASHDPVLWGDEALILNQYAMTVVSKNRYAGGLLAQDLGADIVIMDDGMQNYTLTKDLTFCLVDGKMGFGNGQIIPQGPLRQSLSDGFELSDAFILIGNDERNSRELLPQSKPLFTASLRIKNHDLSLETPYIAFCGIGYPEKFKSSLTEAGLNVVSFKQFGDHYSYSDSDFTELSRLAETNNARLITTEKDYARLPLSFQKQLIDVLSVEIAFDDPDSLLEFVRNKISA